MRLRDYREQIDRLIRGESDLKFMLNGSEDHAAIIVERMFAHAQTEMRILTRRLDPAIYARDELIDQAQSFASDPTTDTRIIVEDISDASLRLHDLSALSDLPNFEIRRLPQDFAEKIEFNYSVMDRTGYRFEEDKKQVNALVRFDDGRFANEAADYFDTLWRISSPAPQPVEAAQT
jgi:hypothetical protein